jgi:CheY-like chemotaxis protein
LKKERFDVAVLDVQMPGMDGLAVAEAVRGNGAGLDPDTPLVAMTAHAMKGDREKFLAAGMDDYVAKPVDRVELKKALMRAMAGRIEIG